MASAAARRCLTAKSYHLISFAPPDVAPLHIHPTTRCGAQNVSSNVTYDDDRPPGQFRLPAQGHLAPILAELRAPRVSAQPHARTMPRPRAPLATGRHLAGAARLPDRHRS